MHKSAIFVVVIVLILIIVGLEYSGILNKFINSNTSKSTSIPSSTSSTHSSYNTKSYTYNANLNGTLPSPQASVDQDVQRGDNVSFYVSPKISIPATDQYGNTCYITGSIELQIVSPTGSTITLPEFTGYYTYEFTASQSGTYQFEFSVITKSYSQYVNYCHADANVNGQINVTSLG